MTSKKAVTPSKVAQLDTSLIQLLDEKNIDLSNPKEIKAVMLTLTLKENLAFFPLVANRLFCEGAYRQMSASNAKGHKVGTPEYAAAIKEGLAVWIKGYLTVAEETRATRGTTVKGKGKTLPFSQAAIIERMSDLAPSGKGEKAIRVHEVLAKLGQFSTQAFIAYYGQSLLQSSSLMCRAVHELKEEQVQVARDATNELLGGVDIV